MNLYRRELKANFKATLFWSLGIVFLVFVGLMKYDATSVADASLNDIMLQLPEAVQIIMGTGTFDLSKASGFYGVLYLYLVFMGATHGGLLGANMLTKEERDKTTEFLCVKPISRQQILTYKLLAALTNVGIFILVTYISSLMAIQLFGRGESFTQDVNLLMIGLTLIEVIFLSIGFCLGATLKKLKLASSVTTSLILFTFMLSMAIDIVPTLKYLKYLSPFKYFDAKAIMGNSLNPQFVILSIFISSCLLFTAYYTYPKRDLSI